MKKLSSLKASRSVFKRIRLLSMAAVVAVGSYVTLIPLTARAVDCTDASGATGSVETTVNIPTDGTYRLWTKLSTASATANSLLATVDAQCIKLGDTALTANTWTWVGHKDADTTTKATLNLTAGQHTVKLLNTEPGIKISRVVLLNDTDCTPTDNGDNCMVTLPADTTAPSAPASLKATVTSNKAVSLSWAASQDDRGVSGYDVYRSTASAAPALVSSTAETWFNDSNLLANTTYSYYVVARDTSSNASAQTAPVSGKTLTQALSGKGKMYGQAKFSSNDADHSTISFAVNGTVRSHDSDANGYYFITDIPAGTYLVKFQAGRSIKYADVKINASRDTVKDITLPQASAVQPPISAPKPFATVNLANGTLSGQATSITEGDGTISVLLSPASNPDPDPDPDPNPSTTNCIATPSACGYPDATNTGYLPTGVELTSEGVTLNGDGDLEITQEGTVIDSKLINACVVVKAPNVTIKRSKITNCISYFNIRLYPNATNFTIEDTEIDGNNFAGQRIALTADSQGPVTMRRVFIHNVTDGPHGGENWLVEDSFFTDFYACDICHSDGFQSAGAINVTLRHNTIHNDPPNYYDPDHPEHDGGKNAVIRIATEQGPVNGFVVENNLLAGGNYAVQVRSQGSGYPQGVVIKNNRIAPSWRFGPFDPGPIDEYVSGTIVFSGNYRDDNLQPLSGF